MGNLQSTPEYNPYTGTYEYNTGYQSDFERYYYRNRMYPPYNSYYPSAAAMTYGQPGAAASYYNSYQQQYYQPSVYSSPYNTLGYGGGYGSPYQQSLYNTTPYASSLYGSPTAYGYNNSYYPNNYLRTYM